MKSDDSFDFFGMMEKQDDAFGDFLSGAGGAAVDNPQVRQYLAITMSHCIVVQDLSLF